MPNVLCLFKNLDPGLFCAKVIFKYMAIVFDNLGKEKVFGVSGSHGLNGRHANIW